MTDLTKTVKRRCTRINAGKPCHPKPLIVSLEPGDIIGLRVLGTRKTYHLPIYSVYLMAVEATVLERKRLKKLAKRGRGR